MSKKKGGKGTCASDDRVEFEAGWFMVKNIQDVICFRAYDAVQGLGKSYTTKQLQELAFQKYHGIGEEDGRGLAEKCMLGIEMFEGIYHDKRNVIACRTEQVLDTIFHLKNDKKIVSDPNPAVKGINLTTLTAKTSTDRSPITGRTIREKGMRVRDAGRKVHAYCMKSSKYNDPNTKLSREQWRDYLKFCRYKMWKETQKKSTSCPPGKETSDMKDQNGSDDVVEDENIVYSPDDEEKEGEKETTEGFIVDEEEGAAIKDWDDPWIFPGYMAWALWGHIPRDVLEEYKAGSFMTSDSCTHENSGASAAGTSSTRKAAANMEDQEREASILDDSSSRGVSSSRGISRQEQSMKLQTLAARQMICTAMVTNTIVNVYKSKKVTLDMQVTLIRDRQKTMEKLVLQQKPECFDNHEHYYATYVPYKVYMDCDAELQELVAQYKILDDEMHAEIDATNQKKERLCGRKRNSGELSSLSSSSASSCSSSSSSSRQDMLLASRGNARDRSIVVSVVDDVDGRTKKDEL
ncbi:hypothetical protein IV203_034200 [Nitzschia inconspicua]|uniref:Uncharacterized protein n=1 Tax=Nitzschia inconspicua TaxID=303405 RepID=A0A9K3M5H2_9STRA|nr:hypothetical protein IV203_034200 [Nitzschia inconspicua]